MAALMLLVTAAGCSKKEVNLPEKYSIIPKPAELVMAKGSFIVDRHTELTVWPLNEETKLVSGFLTDMLGKSASVPIPVTEGAKEGKNSIVMVIDTAASENSEGYTLSVTPKNIVLKSPSAAGLFRGVQTLRQLLPPQVETEGGLAGEGAAAVPACYINDAPPLQLPRDAPGCMPAFFHR